MPPQKTWRLYPSNPGYQKQLAEALGISWVTAQILINRGLESLEAARDFLNPSLKNLPNPFSLPDMEKAVRRLIQALQNKEPIAVYGDYDVDGLTSAALLTLFFKEIGVAVTPYIPDRMKEGYGIQPKALEELKAKGIKVVITADCGTKSHEALAAGKKMGLDVIVTDHHELDVSPPPACAFTNPQLLAKGSPGQELAGVGVVFFLLMALRQKMREENLFENGEPNLKQHLDLVVLGTIGDLAPLKGINRILCAFGLRELAQTKKPGLIALKEVSNLDKRCQQYTAGTFCPIDPSDVGFRLAPRINAGGRIAKASLGLDLLCETNLERARGLAKILDQCNQDRQAMQEKHLKEAWDQVLVKDQRLGLVVSSPNWHPGIVGLVASRLTENYYRPSVALSVEGEFARGSARSIPGIHIVEMLEACKDLLEQFGGHTAAAGLTLRLTNLQSFEERLETVLRQRTTEDLFIPFLKVDCELRLKDIQTKLMEELELLKPFGIQNPEPIFLGRQLKWSDARIVGEKHLKFKVTDTETKMEAIGFNMGERHPLQTEQGDIVFVPQWNTFQETTTIQLKIKDLKLI